MHHPSIRRQRCLFDSFIQRWVGVAGAGDILGGAAKFHHRNGLSNQSSGIRTNDVYAKYAVGSL